MCRIGRRLLVRKSAPGLGTRCRLCARVCWFDLNSARSARLKAQVSTTCSPWVLMTVTICPAETKAALPRLAGISMRQSMVPTSQGLKAIMSISTIPPRGKGRHAHRGSGRTLVGGEIGREDFVHPGVIALEVGQENAHASDIG